MTKSSRSKLKQVTITPHIYLYLQAFYFEELEQLSAFINRTFHHQFVLSKQSDGHFYTLRIQKTEEAFRFLNDFEPYAYPIPSMQKIRLGIPTQFGENETSKHICCCLQSKK